MVIMLFLAFVLPGQPKPVVSYFVMESVERCLEEAADILVRAQGLRRPGSVEVACTVTVAGPEQQASEQPQGQPETPLRP